ncbi:MULTISPECIES: glycoside hydrolase family 3 N-terminal domain-containing protein [unclassified Synechococcus]|jgi:beta-glucosidase|uniref:glycoside hydrolase family 3 N-terminal domain-containing protein n=1 Tax=unclassified Synechococcus TaxID=2626047 RepID=UPI000C508852|nr:MULTISPECIES: glycoside hydrolase family 3 N-terminal domain-containing protein [unclassified Synechococcus]PIL01516.1 glycosyl hydrolase [Synechococcus sp. 65AY640]
MVSMSGSGSPVAALEQPLSLARQVAQLLVVPVSARLGSQSPPREILKRLIQEVGIGGIWITEGHVAEALLLIEEAQSWATLPLLVAAEASRGLALQGATSFPHPLGLSRLGSEAERWAEQWGRITAREAAAIGINWLLGPVAEPLGQGPAELALAEEPHLVLQLARAFVRGCEQAVPGGILTTARSFPGQDWVEPPQAGAALRPKPTDVPWCPRLSLTLEELQAGLWLPFRSLVEQVGAISVAPVVLPEWDERWPISFLPGRLTQLLRQEWGFSGLIVAEGLDQGFLDELAVGVGSSPHLLAVRALQAGADLLLAPPDPVAAVTAIVEAVRQGSLDAQAIAQSVTRVLRAKQRLFPSASALLKQVWPALAETDFSLVPGWMGAKDPSDPALCRGFSDEQLKPLLLGDPLAKDSPLAKLFGTRPPLPRVARLGSLLAEQDIAPCQAAMARGGVTGGQALPLPAPPGSWNWIWQDLAPGAETAGLSAASPALSIPAGLGFSPLLSHPLTPLSLLETALGSAGQLIFQAFVEEPLPNYVLDWLQQQRERVAAVVVYGNLSFYRRLQAHFQWANAIHSLNPDPWAQAEAMQRLFPHRLIPEKPEPQPASTNN